MDCEIYWLQAVELWMVKGKLVAQQQAYVHPFYRESYRALDHYFCSKCGEVWGRRIVPEFQSPHHQVFKEICRPCGGEGSMLTPWEAMHMEVLGPNVLAYLLLQETEEVKHD